MMNFDDDDDDDDDDVTMTMMRCLDSSGGGGASRGLVSHLLHQFAGPPHEKLTHSVQSEGLTDRSSGSRMKKTK